MNIEINDAAFNSYRRLILSLPQGFSYKIIEKNDAIVQGDQQNIKLLWTGPVVSNVQKIKVVVATQHNIEGNFRIPVKYEFLHEQQKKIFTLGSIDLQISETKRTDVAATKTITFELPDVAQAFSEKAQQNSYYSIQILQSSEYVSEAQLRKYFNLEQEKIIEILQDGKYYYLIGVFTYEKEAKSWLDRHSILNMQGMVVRVDNGQLIKK
ncbi:MAG: hypothetical protein ACK4GL_03435 [Flavobacteriales bacterium]